MMTLLWFDILLSTKLQFFDSEDVFAYIEVFGISHTFLWLIVSIIYVIDFLFPLVGILMYVGLGWQITATS